MDNELEKVDIIRSRFRVSYEEARNALSDARGDVLSALSTLENAEHTDLLELGVDMAVEVQRLLAGGPIKRLRVKYGDKLIASKPLALTAFAALAVGVGAVLISRLTIEVDQDKGDAVS
jgi:hypothetical protein